MLFSGDSGEGGGGGGGGGGIIAPPVLPPGGKYYKPQVNVSWRNGRNTAGVKVYMAVKDGATSDWGPENIVCNNVTGNSVVLYPPSNCYIRVRVVGFDAQGRLANYARSPYKEIQIISLDSNAADVQNLHVTSFDPSTGDVALAWDTVAGAPEYIEVRKGDPDTPWNLATVLTSSLAGNATTYTASAGGAGKYMAKANNVVNGVNLYSVTEASVLTNPSLITPIGTSLAYKPKSQMLSAVDNGTIPVITVANFDVEIAGIGTVSVTGGTINCLDTEYGKKVFTWYDDPELNGGTVTFGYSTNQADALSGVNRFFMGSIPLPDAGGAQTFGNGDGGSWYGNEQDVLPSDVATGTTNGGGGSGAWVNADSLKTVNDAIYAYASPSSNPNAVLCISGFPVTSWKPSLLKAQTKVTAISGTGATALLEYTLDGGVNWITKRTITAVDSAWDLAEVALSQTQDASKCKWRLTLPGGGGSSSAAANAGTGADDAAVGTQAWSNPSNATGAPNNVFATASGTAMYGNFKYSHYLKLTGFGFSIPNSTVQGIVVKIKRKGTYQVDPMDPDYDRYVHDWVIRLVVGGTVSGDDKADRGFIWPSTNTERGYGGSNILWGLTPTYTQINDNANFGVVIQTAMYSDVLAGVPTAYVDSVEITVYYSGSSMSSTGQIKKAVMTVTL